MTKMTKQEAVSPLAQMAIEQQQRLARNTHELAKYYSPHGHIPDVHDFMSMYERVKTLTTDNVAKQVKYLWPQASEAFNAQLITRATWVIENQEAFNALAATLPKGQTQTMTAEQMYQFAHDNSRMGQIGAAA